MSFALLGLVFGISGRKIYDWYRNVLSGFDDPEAQKRLHEHDTVDPALIDKETGKPKKVFVPILKPENFGENMTTDDKNIGGEVYTAISNKDTGKIAVLIMSVKAGIVSDVLLKNVPAKILMAVKTVTKDLAENYDWMARTCFMNAMKIADKFHVIQLAMEALQAIRIRYRQAAITKEREQKEKWKKDGNKRKDLPDAETYENGETEKTLLARSRYLLFKFREQWTETQAERAEILFREFPEIKEAYDLICSFRNFYKCQIGKGHRARESLGRWYEKTKTSKIEEIRSFRHTIKRHEGEILNHFEEGHTNAFAESLNNKIQGFVRSNYGIRDRDFFHFRMLKHFS
jgi:transposase